MLLFDDCGFVHIPKNAGTSIKHLILTSGPTMFLGQVNDPDENLREPVNQYSPHFNPAMAPERIMLSMMLERVTLFTVVRNPWDRFVSWYQYRVNQNPEFDLSFRDFMLNLLGKGDYNPKTKKNSPGSSLAAKLQSSYFHDGFVYDLVLRFEHLEDDWDLVRTTTRLDFGLPRLNSSRHAHYREYFDAELAEYVALLERPIIERFGYGF